MNYKFPSTLRIIKKDQFDRVFAEKKKTYSKYFTIFSRKNELTFPRLGIGVSKKNINKAVQRNFFKRIIKEEFRLNQHKLKNVDMLVFVNSRAKEASKEELKNCIKKQTEAFL